MYDFLLSYSKKDIVPMHMPGHKRNADFCMENPYSIDVTEADGLDDLHHPEGMIRETMNRMKDLYGTRESYLLVGGSTCGILAAVSACCKKGGAVFLDRSCHRSVYHAVYLLGLRPVYLMPEIDREGGMPLGISAAEFEKKLACVRGAMPTAVILTSPTYEGIVTDVREIAGRAREKGIYVIVDEAHGAHLPFLGGEIPCKDADRETGAAGTEVADRETGVAGAEVTDGETGVAGAEVADREAGAADSENDAGHGGSACAGFFRGSRKWPSAIYCGADIVVQSLHKTLPALTQTAVMHICSGRVPLREVERYLDIYETSSPSYVLMASISQCADFLRKKGKAYFRRYGTLLAEFEREAGGLQTLSLWRHERKEPSKIVIQTGKSRLSGRGLGELLRQKYGIEVEMEAAGYIVAMTSPADSGNNFRRLLDALLEIDRQLAQGEGQGNRETAEQTGQEKYAASGPAGQENRKATGPEGQGNRKATGPAEYRKMPEPVLRMDAYEAANGQQESVPFAGSVGRISAEYAFVYPPGAPFLAPGEEITAEVVGKIREAEENGLHLYGLSERESGRIRVAVE